MKIVPRSPFGMRYASVYGPEPPAASARGMRRIPPVLPPSGPGRKRLKGRAPALLNHNGELFALDEVSEVIRVAPPLSLPVLERQGGDFFP
jgi:hypothetical protein